MKLSIIFVLIFLSCSASDSKNNKRSDFSKKDELISSESKWKEMLGKGAYTSYSYTITSADDKDIWVLTVDVSNNKVVCREYVKVGAYKWRELGDDVNSHDIGKIGLTIDEIYSRCKGMVDQDKFYASYHTDGVLLGCNLSCRGRDCVGEDIPFSSLKEGGKDCQKSSLITLGDQS